MVGKGLVGGREESTYPPTKPDQGYFDGFSYCPRAVLLGCLLLWDGLCTWNIALTLTHHRSWNITVVGLYTYITVVLNIYGHFS